MRAVVGVAWRQFRAESEERGRRSVMARPYPCPTYPMRSSTKVWRLVRRFRWMVRRSAYCVARKKARLPAAGCIGTAVAKEMESVSF